MKRKLLTAAALCFAAIIGLGVFGMNTMVKRTYASLDQVQAVDLDGVSDGT